MPDPRRPPPTPAYRASVEAARVAAHCRATLPAGAFALPEEYRYAALPLAVIDSIFSIGVRYDTTRATVARYAAAVGLSSPFVPAWPPAADTAHPIAALVALGDQLGVDRLAEEVFVNRQRTSTHAGAPRKAAAVLEAARLLHTHGVETFQAFTALTPQARHQLALAWQTLPGQGSGIAWRYFTMLAGDTQDIKPDRMICRFVTTAVERTVTPDEARDLLLAACTVLQHDLPTLTPRALDYAIWQHQRTQPAPVTPPVTRRA